MPIAFTVVVAACSDAGSDATTQGHLELLLDGQKVEYQTVLAEELRSAPGEPVVGAQVTATRSGSDADGVDLQLPLLAPGAWEYDAASEEASTAAAYPRLDVRRGGHRYRCYPGIPSVERGTDPVRCQVEVTDGAERVYGSFSGLLAEVDASSLEPLGATVEVTEGFFEAPQGPAARDPEDTPH